MDKKEKIALACSEIEKLVDRLCEKYGKTETFDAAALTLGAWCAVNTDHGNAYKRAQTALEYGYKSMGKIRSKEIEL